MTFVQRFKSIVAGMLMIASGVILILVPEDGYKIIVLILSITIIIAGIKKLIYYITMARYMVDGKIALYMGIMFLDAGIFTYTLNDIPSVYIMMYLVLGHLAYGVIDIMRSFEAKRCKAHTWKITFAEGSLNILLAILCVVFRNRTDIVVYVYSAGLVYYAIIKIITACRKSAIVYIQ